MCHCLLTTKLCIFREAVLQTSACFTAGNLVEQFWAECLHTSGNLVTALLRYSARRTRHKLRRSIYVTRHDYQPRHSTRWNRVSVFHQATQANSASYPLRDGKWVPAGGRRCSAGMVGITFRVSRRRREMYCGHPRLVCLCVCPRPHAYTIARTRM